ncbi:MAG: hypothetical protein K0R51_939 [Cytophagaceae bacterium]|nr:hypothetical protein [Cytophagaceae bacterium]
MTELFNSPLLLSLFLTLLFILAFLYSSVGHGGASGYLAVLVLFNAAPDTIKTSALLLNVFVSFISFIMYARNGYFNWKLFLPFALASIPAAYLGAGIQLDEFVYRKILGICLLFPILRLAGLIGTETDELKSFNWIYGLIIGAVIGLLSGMIGIGGGIILSPIILLLHWAKMKETAAVSALFIFVNSIAGLAGHLSKGILFESYIFVLLVVAIIGGLLGSYLGARMFQNKLLSYILAFVLLIASIKLIVT